MLAGWAGLAYGVYLTVIALRSPPGTELAGHWVLASRRSRRRWRCCWRSPRWRTRSSGSDRLADAGAWVFSATGDWLLAIPWWTQSFVFGWPHSCWAHLCFVGAMLPWQPSRAVACAHRRRRRDGVGVGGAAGVVLAHLGQDKLTVPVTVYIVVLCAMVCTALLARLPTSGRRWARCASRPPTR